MIEKLSEDLRPEQFSSLTAVFEHMFSQHGELPAFSCLGQTLSYSQVDDLSSRFANFIQTHTDLEPGDKIALQLPNILQFPIAFYGAVKAGLIVVNTNPLYTEPEMAHQFQDSGVKAIVILANFCDKLEAILAETEIETVIVTELFDLQSPLKRIVMNQAAKHIKKLVPNYYLPQAIGFNKTLKMNPSFVKVTHEASGDDIAIILYTGGTTGNAKGAMLSHNNLIANMMQLRSRCLLVIRDKIENIAAPLPLYHSYAFLLHCLVMPYAGNHNLLVPNPRDLDSFIKLLRQNRINGLVGINTLYLALLRHPEFSTLDFSEIKFSGAGGMAMSTAVSKEWEEVTGCEVIEGYGLTECSPVVSVNIPGKVKMGTVGPPVPETEIRVVDENGKDVEQGQKGELWVRGPQVMLGYWRQRKATEQILTDDGWFKTGDYVEVGNDNYIKIVDRKKDMILVSGFNVFPNEVEDWVDQHPEVVESAVIGVPDERTGEAVKLFVVPANNGLEKESILEHCQKGMTAYKIPDQIVFVEDLPKSNVGKVLRRKLRDDTA